MIVNRYQQFYFFVAFLFSATLLKGQTQLGYQLQSGDVFVIRQTAHQTMTQQMDGATHEITNDLEGVFEFKVDAVKNDNYVMQLQYKDFAMKSSSNLQGTIMDVRASEPKSGDIFSAIFSALLGQKLGVEMSKAGKVVEVTGGDSLINAMINAVPDIDDFTRNVMRKSLEKDFGSQGLANSFEQMTYFYPDHSVAIGDSWETAFKGKISGNNTWTWEKNTGDTASISGSAAIAMNNTDAAMTLSLSGTQEILIEASAKNGFLQKMMVSGSGKGHSVITQMGEAEIPTTLEQTITYELITN